VVHLCAVLLNEGLRRHVHRGSRQLKSVVLHRVGLLCVVHGRGIHLRVVLHRVGLLCEVHGRGIHLRGNHLHAVRLHVGQNYEE
jgi:hypothetical protein